MESFISVVGVIIFPEIES